MITVLTTQRPVGFLGTLERFEVSCPHCGHFNVFSYYSPLFCGKCLERMPDAVLLLEKEDKRQEYHKTGKVTPEVRKKT